MIASSFVKTVSPDQKLQGMQIPGARWSNFVASAALEHVVIARSIFSS